MIFYELRSENFIYWWQNIISKYTPRAVITNLALVPFCLLHNYYFQLQMSYIRKKICEITNIILLMEFPVEVRV